MSALDIVLILVIAGALCLALRKIVRDRKNGKCCGCGSCGACRDCSACGSEKGTRRV